MIDVTAIINVPPFSKSKIFPGGVLIQGRPGKIVRDLTEEELERYLPRASQHYIDLKEQYQ